MSKGHYCGLFGISGDKDAVMKTYYGLQALQHRGQEGAGIASTDGRELKVVTGRGLVTDVFQDKEALKKIANPVAIGHVRYSTTGGSSNPRNVQPLFAHFQGGYIAVAHNGDLTNKTALRDGLERGGALFQGTTDSEAILHLIARTAPGEIEERLLTVLPQLEGAYSLLILVPGKMIAVRDPRGFRPLVEGRLGDAVLFSSEDCAFDLFDAERVREIEPGEIAIADAHGVRYRRFSDPHTKRVAQCIFEHIYFARPDSTIFGDSVHQVRMKLGRRLAIEHPVEADLVTAVPDSGNSASIGYSLESGIPLDRGFIKNHYVGRTFIEPEPDQRSIKVALKLNAVREVVNGKRVIVVDDSIVRGTTALSRVRSLRKAGAKEIHFRVSCPPTRHPCFFGIDFPTPEELIANQKSIPEIARFLGVDSLGYLSEAGLAACVSSPADRYCMACFNGDYPCRVPARKEEGCC
jgi:amidophosphoribosyltransferase